MRVGIIIIWILYRDILKFCEFLVSIEVFRFIGFFVCCIGYSIDIGYVLMVLFLYLER